jgi:hypothetical protein
MGQKVAVLVQKGWKITQNNTFFTSKKVCFLKVHLLHCFGDVESGIFLIEKTKPVPHIALHPGYDPPGSWFCSSQNNKLVIRLAFS